MKSGIYQFLNTVTGKCYVGQAVNLHKRKREHFATLRAGRHNSAKLQRSWVKYGAGTFVFEVLELVKDKDLLMKAEQKWIDALKAYENGYNIQPYACRGCFGMIISAETRAKTSTTLTGVKHSPERCAINSVAHKGQKPSDETRAKMSAKKLSPEHIAALIAANTGRHPSEETRGKLRAWQIGKTISEEQRAKISATLKGRKISPECLRKRIGQKRSPEVKARMTEGQLRRYEVARLAA